VGDYRHETNLVSIEMDSMLEKYHIICNECNILIMIDKNYKEIKELLQKNALYHSEATG
jgi:hypothetical protein